MILYVFTKDGIEYMEIYLVEALFLQKMNHQQLAFFFEVSVPDSRTAFGFISGIFSKTSKSSSSSSEAGDSPEVLFFFLLMFKIQKIDMNKRF